MDLSSVGRVLLLLGAVLAILGVALVLAGKGIIPKLPGDLSFGRGNLRVFIPLGTSVVLSAILTVLLNLFLRR